MISAVLGTHLSDPSSSFREDAPRPPVPGGEETPCPPPPLASRSQGGVAKAMPLSFTPRRNEDGLGEPEGSASPDSPLSRWTKSLHSLLSDQDGAQLYRTFLEREKCVDSLDFWFACNGFRQMDIKDAKTWRVAKAIYKRYVENNSVVSKQLKPATKTFIKDSLKRATIDSTTFDQAQTEVQTAMEDNAYQMFLTSDIYLEYVRSGGENPAYSHSAELGRLKVVCGYLPTLNEEEEWSCVELRNKSLPSALGLSSKALRATADLRAAEALENGCRSFKRNDPVNPYHVNSGHVFAPATSANDSEISSDAMTDDSMSMTDSSVDEMPPHRLGSRKHIQRAMQRSVKANGQVSLPHFPRTSRLPKEMTPVEPAAFAADLISRLERLKQEKETMDCLEERLQQMKEEEEKEDSDLPLITLDSRETLPAQHPLALIPSGSYEEDPQAILDDHLSRVLKTPGCQSPGVARHSPRSRSPEFPRGVKPLPVFAPCPVLTKGFITKQTTKHVHHHYIHHHNSPKTKEQLEADAARRAQCFCTSSTDYCCYLKSKGHPKGMEVAPGPTELFGSSRSSTLSKRNGKVAAERQLGSEGCPTASPGLSLPGNEADRSQNVWQWMLESERQNKHKPHSVPNAKKGYSPDSTRSLACERVTRHHQSGTNGHARTAQPAHPFVQDPAMPPLPPPNTLAQLEEACRRLTEVSKPPKQWCSASNMPRDRTHPAVQVGSAAFSGVSLPEDHKDPKKPPAAPGPPPSELVVTYFFCGEEIPYRRLLKAQSLTLGHFKEQLSKKGSYRYYFKKPSNEFDCGAVFEEIWEDDSMLPMYEGRILGKVERID